MSKEVMIPTFMQPDFICTINNMASTYIMFYLRCAIIIEPSYYSDVCIISSTSFKHIGVVQ